MSGWGVVFTHGKIDQLSLCQLYLSFDEIANLLRCANAHSFLSSCSFCIELHPCLFTAVSAVSSGVESRVYQRMASLMLWAESLQDGHETAANIRWARLH